MTERYFLPSGYKQVEYLESTGTQYIDTEYLLTDNTKIEISGQNTDVSQTDGTIFSANTQPISADRVQMNIGNGSVGSGRYLFIRLDGTLSSSQDIGTNTFVCIADTKNKKAYINDVEIISSYSGSINKTTTLSIFARHSTSHGYTHQAKLKVYYCKIYDNNTLVRDFVPCIDPNNVAGMYDTVNGVFYDNDGTGTFTTGEVIQSPKNRIVATDSLHIPEEYDELEYIESTGTQYIDTEYNPNYKTQIKTKAYISSIGTNTISHIFGTRDADVAGAGYGLATINSTLSSDFFGSRAALYTSVPLNQWLDIDKNGNVCKVNDKTVTNTASTDSVSRSLTLFGIHLKAEGQMSYSGILRFRETKIWDNGTLVRDFVPARRKSDGVLGMYDKVTKTLFTNQGTGVFNAGSVITPVRLTKKFVDDGYKVLEYIESTGSQYVDTGLKYNSKYKYSLKYRITGAGQVPMFGYRNQTAITGGGVSLTYSGGESILYFNGSSNQNWHNLGYSYSEDTGIHTLILNPCTTTGTSIVCDGTISTKTFDLTHWVSDYNLYLFANNIADATFTNSKKSQFYYFKVYDENNNLINDFIPTESSSGVLGMYDLANDIFCAIDGWGKAITGKEVRVLPRKFYDDGYTALEYIESTGTQYINPNFIPTKDSLKIRYEAQKISGGDSMPFGIQNNGTTTLNMNLYGTTNLYYRLLGSNVNFTPSGYVATDRHEYEISKEGYYLDDTKLGTPSAQGTFVGNTNKMFVFGRPNSAGTGSEYILVGKIFWFQVYEDNTLVRDLIPAKNYAGAAGMYDLANDVFYPNAGTGTFTTGSELPKYVLLDRTYRLVMMPKEGTFILPSAYQRVEYIESTGTQYINTNWYLPANKNNFEMRIDFQDTGNQPSTWAKICGVDKGQSGETQYYLLQFHNISPDEIVAHNTDLNTSVTWSNTVGSRNVVVMSYNNGSTTITKNGAEAKTLTGAIDARSTAPCFLFAGSRYNDGSAVAGVKSKIRMFSWSVKVDGEYQRNYVPVRRRSDNVVGMYDLVTGTFFTNKGTGTFISGQTIKEPLRLVIMEGA